MTTPDIEPIQPDIDPAKEHDDERRRRTLLLILLVFMLLLCCLGYLVVRYLIKPQPVTQMLPVVNQVYYPPAYKFTIKGVDAPVAVAVSPDNQRLYVVESTGDRLVKIFDREGRFISSFSAPFTTVGGRQPFYIAIDAGGRIFMTDRISNSIQIFDADGNFIDAIIGPDMTLSKVMAGKFPQGIPAGMTFNKGMDNAVSYLPLGEKLQTIPLPKSDLAWAPLGIRFDRQGNLLYSDVTDGKHSLNIIPAAALISLKDFNPQIKTFGGVQGKEPGQLDYPQLFVADSKGNFYVSDGNNYRIDVFSPEGTYKKFFAFGSTTSGLNLPRGIWMDDNDHLHVADSVGATIRVYDVSGIEPVFLYSFGAFGITEDKFNYPGDIYIDGTGRLYVADKGNNRIQVWSY